MNLSKFIRGCLCPFLIITFTSNISSQRVYRKISTDVYQQKPALNSTQVISQKTEIEEHNREFKKKPEFKKVVLPVVFHVLFTPGEEYLDQHLILSQIDALNRDFGKKAYSSKHVADTLEKFKEKAVDTEIQFCLASIDPNGNTTMGINYSPSSTNGWGLKDEIKSNKSGGQGAWDPDHYINIWVADLGDSVSGYAQMPGGPSNTDGIVVDYTYFGIKSGESGDYKEGKTLTHLMGNYLNLYDLWGPCFCCDDGVEDTPIHNAPNYGTTSEYRHLSTCDGYSVEMSMNFMDNTDDSWMYMFTLGQKRRMQAVLSEGGARFGLVNGNTSCSRKTDQIEARSPSRDIVKIFPNPSHGPTTIEITSEIKGPATLEIYNPFGQLMYRTDLELVAGINHKFLNAGSWADGIYTIHIQREKYILNQKFILH